jgi:hypothetical protein
LVKSFIRHAACAEGRTIEGMSAEGGGFFLGVFAPKGSQAPIISVDFRE